MCLHSTKFTDASYCIGAEYFLAFPLSERSDLLPFMALSSPLHGNVFVKTFKRLRSSCLRQSEVHTPSTAPNTTAAAHPIPDSRDSMTSGDSETFESLKIVIDRLITALSNERMKTGTKHAKTIKQKVQKLEVCTSFCHRY